MPPREFRPPEERTSPVLFFVVGVLMVVISLWTVWDEIFTRRPWKEFQAQFNSYESGLVRDKLADSRKKVAVEIDRLDARIAKLEASVASDAQLAALRQELADRELKAFEKVQEYGFAKAKFDEAYFELNEGIRKGHGIAEIQSNVDELRQEVARTKNPAEEAEAARDGVKAKIEAKRKPLTDLQKRRREVAKEVLDLEHRLDSIGRRTQEIKQIVLKAYERNNFGEPVLRADRCQSCHLGASLAGFEKAPAPLATHPNREFYLGKHDLSLIGCQSCHGGQGSALKTVGLAHGEDHFWEDKLLPKNERGSKCYACHGNVINLEKAPILARGVSLVRELGCFGCHKIPGTSDLRKRGPDLSRIREKVKPGWLVSWIKRPKDYNPRTKMPFFSLSDKESMDIASYLWGASSRKAASQKIDGLGEAAAIAKGKELFEAVGCLGCHVRDGRDDNPGPALKGIDGRPVVIRNRDFAPAVGNIVNKVQPDWLVRWLENPKSYWHGTTMPNLRLSGDEATSVAAYLLSISPAKKGPEVRLDDRDASKRGETLVRRRGCHGCHVIPGMETASKVGPDLTRFAAKKVFELSFGNVVNIEHNWDTWTFGKLKNPKIYQTERESLRMPNFDLSDDETAALRTFLRAMVEHGPPHSVRHELGERAKKIELGRRMIEKYNCTGCHVVENWGGDLLRRYKDKNNGPPNLNGEGEKVQPDWFFGFLKNVVVLRPWLKVRMPSFEMPEKDMATLVNYFAALDGKLQPYFHFDKTKVKPGTLKVARDLFAKAECLSCHGDWPPPPGKEPPTAPSLSFAKHRLRPDWIFKWIANPQKIRPGSKMPAFFEGAGIQAEILSGKRTGSEDGRWLYDLTQKGEAELAEGKPATLRIGGKSIVVIAGESDEKKIKISSPENLGARFGRAAIESHGEPIDEEVLGGDGYRQIDALKKFLMIEENFKPAAPPQAAAPSAPGRG